METRKRSVTFFTNRRLFSWHIWHILTDGGEKAGRPRVRIGLFPTV